MIPKEEREKDKAILSTSTVRPWIAVSPRSQEGGPQLASFGGLDAPGLPTSLRSAEDMAPVDVSAAQARMTWEQHAANCQAAARAVNRLPLYIADAEEMERRIARIEDELESFKCAVKGAASDGTYGYDTSDSQRRYEAKVEALTDVLRILRGDQ